MNKFLPPTRVVRAVPPRSRLRPVAVMIGGLSFAWFSVSCVEPVDPTLPSVEAIGAFYEYDRSLEAELSGNVAVLVVAQSAQQIRRGGALWARVGPYVFVFSEETRRLFEEYPGLAAVRVVTRLDSGEEIARAQLTRDALSEVLWRRSLNIAGLARRDGSERVTLLQDLVRWGETHTEFEYNPRFTRSR